MSKISTETIISTPISLIEPIDENNNLYNAVIEISSNSGRVKYEIDKNSGMLLVDRIMPTAMFYPANYGFIPKTLAGDGDPVDVLIIASENLIPGSIIAVRPIGVLKTKDEKGEDAKILTVPGKKIDYLMSHIESYKDISEICKQIQHFFENYKKLENGKWVEVIGWGDKEEAMQIIKNGIDNYSGSK